MRFRFNMRGNEIGSNVCVGKRCFFRSPKRKTTIGSNVKFGDGSFIEVGGTKRNAFLKIGNDFSATSNLFVSCNHAVTIGEDVLIGNNVRIYDSNHGVNPECDIPYEQQPLVCKPVSIGDNTWIGDNCIILAGASIGKRSVIGAGSIVTGNISDYSIAVGSPARVIKKWDSKVKSWVKV